MRAFKLMRIRCHLLGLAAAFVGIYTLGLFGCSNSERETADTGSESGESEQRESDEEERGGYSDHKDFRTNKTACSRCKDYEICLDGRCICEPSCDGKSIKDDGCGGQCECPEGKTANEQLECVALSECSGSCETAGWECGEICGVSCGQCGSNHRCETGYCHCEPSCDGTRCDDGCGGTCSCADGTVCNLNGECVPPGECDDTCETAGYTCDSICGESCGVCSTTESCIDHKCERAVNCTDCSLKLSLVEKNVDDGQLSTLTLAMDYEPVDGEPKPRMFDIRLKVDEDVSLNAVTVGESLKNVDKDLYTDPDTLRKWQKRADGTYRFVAFSVADNREIEKGRLMTLTFTADENRAPLFSIVKRNQIFAPPIADEALQLSSYDETIKVTQ